MADHDHTLLKATGVRRSTPARIHAVRRSFAILQTVMMVSAVFAVVGLASAEIEFAHNPLPSGPAAGIGNSQFWVQWAQLDPGRAGPFLREAARMNPRDSSVWIALGLAEERDAQERPAKALSSKGVAAARVAFETAFSVDRQYAPAWALANFCLRHKDADCFWRAEARAALRSPSLADLAIADSGGNAPGASANLTDLAPLLDLAGHMEPSPVKMLDRLASSIGGFAVMDGATPTFARAIGQELEKAWLNDLIGQERWEDATLIARRMESRHDPADKARLDDLVDRLIAAGRAKEAVDVWNGYTEFAPLAPFKRASVTNGDFAVEPGETGFDWRLGLHRPDPNMAARQIAKHWRPNLLEIRLPGDQPEQVPLAEQWLAAVPRTYRVRFEYSTQGITAPTGIRWSFAAHRDSRATERDRRIENDSLSPSLAPSSGWRTGEWTFSNGSAPPLTLARLRLIYSREAGTERARGLFSLRMVRLEIL